MKRYDTYKEIVSKQTGAVSRDFTIEDFKKVDSELFFVYVQCRKCGNIHQVQKKCEVCDTETKLNNKKGSDAA